MHRPGHKSYEKTVSRPADYQVEVLREINNIRIWTCFILFFDWSQSKMEIILMDGAEAELIAFLPTRYSFQLSQVPVFETGRQNDAGD